jgi:hypothetical protein
LLQVSGELCEGLYVVKGFARTLHTLCLGAEFANWVCVAEQFKAGTSAGKVMGCFI